MRAAHPERPVVVGVAGGSGSGKSTVVGELVRILGSDVTTVIQHDAYYRDLSHQSTAERSLVNFDHPDSLETDLLVADLRQLRRGMPVRIPVYDFATHTRAAGADLLAPTPVLILDGILVLAEGRLRALMDLKVYVDTEPDLRLVRRLRRDIVERGRSSASVLDQYEATVRPMHLQYVEPSKRHADHRVFGGGDDRVAVDRLVARVRALLDERRP